MRLKCWTSSFQPKSSQIKGQLYQLTSGLYQAAYREVWFQQTDAKIWLFFVHTRTSHFLSETSFFISETSLFLPKWKFLTFRKRVNPACSDFAGNGVNFVQISCEMDKKVLTPLWSVLDLVLGVSTARICSFLLDGSSHKIKIWETSI